MEDLAPTDAKRAENLLRDAHIQRMRQQWAAAETLCRQALELVPEDLMGLEMLGDLLLDKGSTENALETYRKALALAPEKASLEEKVARVVLLRAEEERERLEAQLLLTNPRKKGQARRNTLAAILLSVLWPGAGHLFLGQTRKGLFLIAIWAVFLLSGSVLEFTKMLIGFAGLLPRGEQVNDVLAGFGIMGLLDWLYGLIDVTAASGQGRKSAGE